jgi:SAM-dependent methyltransferase
MEMMSPSVVLAAYAEPLLDGRRVVVFGDATTDLGAELVARGARTVHIYDPEAPRAALAAGRNRSKQVTVVPLDTADIAVRDGAFDVAFIPDLSALPAADVLLRRVRRALSPRGAAIIASPNPDARFTLTPHTSGTRRATPLGYYELYDVVSGAFAEVRMFGQTPFVGYAIVDFAPEDEPEVGLDSGLLPTGAEEPEWFVALAGNDVIETDAYSIVQLPASRVLGGVDGQLETELRAARGREAELVERLATAEAASLATETAAQRQRSTDDEASAATVSALHRDKATLSTRVAELESQHRDKAGLATRVAELETQLREKTMLAARVGELEAQLREKAALTAKVADLEAQVREKAALVARVSELESQHRGKADASTKLAALEGSKAQLSRELATAATEKATSQKMLAERDAEKAKLEERALTAESRIEKLTALATEQGPDDVTRLETALSERGERVRHLEKDLKEAERVGRELVRELKAAQSAPGPAFTNGAKEDDGRVLGVENARLRADLEAMSWTVQELEGRLSRDSNASAR